MQDAGYCTKGGTCLKFPVIIGETGSNFSTPHDEEYFADMVKFMQKVPPADEYPSTKFNNWIWYVICHRRKGRCYHIVHTPAGLHGIRHAKVPCCLKISLKSIQLVLAALRALSRLRARSRYIDLLANNIRHSALMVGKTQCNWCCWFPARMCEASLSRGIRKGEQAMHTKQQQSILKRSELIKIYTPREYCLSTWLLLIHCEH